MDINKAARNLFLCYVGYKYLKSALKTPDTPTQESRWEQFLSGFLYPKVVWVIFGIMVIAYNVFFAIIQ